MTLSGTTDQALAGDQALAATVHAAVLHYVTTLGTCADGALVQAGDGLLRITSDLPIGNGNQVLITGEEATPAALEVAVAWMRDQGRAFRVTLRDGIDDQFAPVLARLGFTGRPWAPGMALHPIPAGDRRPDPATGLVIEPVVDGAGLADFVRAMAPAYGLAEEATARVVSPALLREPGVSLVLGRVAGAPVATGMAIRTGRVAGVYFIGTVPVARGQGHGAAITAHLGTAAAAAGCDTAILQASPMGLGVYERLGYRTVLEYVAWTPAGPGDR